VNSRRKISSTATPTHAKKSSHSLSTDSTNSVSSHIHTVASEEKTILFVDTPTQVDSPVVFSNVDSTEINSRQSSVVNQPFPSLPNQKLQPLHSEIEIPSRSFNKRWLKGLEMYRPEELIFTNVDFQIRPIVENNVLDPSDKPSIKLHSLQSSFQPLTPEMVAKLPLNEFQAFMSAVYKALGRTFAAQGSSEMSNSCADRLNILAYLQTIAHITQVANLVVSTNFLTLLLRSMMQNPFGTMSSSEISAAMGSKNVTNNHQATINSASILTINYCRVCAATIVGLNIRFATFIPAQLPGSSGRKAQDNVDLISAFVGILKDASTAQLHSSPGKKGALVFSDIKLKRKAIAALGELLFYIAVQDEAQGKDDSASARWTFPNSAVEMLAHCLTDADETIRYCAVKSLENIFIQGSLDDRKRFGDVTIAHNLREIVLKEQNETLQVSPKLLLSAAFQFV
jgi:hypothetical protein